MHLRNKVFTRNCDLYFQDSNGLMGGAVVLKIGGAQANQEKTMCVLVCTEVKIFCSGVTLVQYDMDFFAQDLPVRILKRRHLSFVPGFDSSDGNLFLSRYSNFFTSCSPSEE